MFFTPLWAGLVSVLLVAFGVSIFSTSRLIVVLSGYAAFFLASSLLGLGVGDLVSPGTLGMIFPFLMAAVFGLSLVARAASVRMTGGTKPKRQGAVVNLTLCEVGSRFTDGGMPVA